MPDLSILFPCIFFFWTSLNWMCSFLSSLETMPLFGGVFFPQNLVIYLKSKKRKGFLITKVIKPQWGYRRIVLLYLVIKSYFKAMWRIHLFLMNMAVTFSVRLWESLGQYKHKQHILIHKAKWQINRHLLLQKQASMGKFLKVTLYINSNSISNKE